MRWLAQGQQVFTTAGARQKHSQPQTRHTAVFFLFLLTQRCHLPHRKPKKMYVQAELLPLSGGAFAHCRSFALAAWNSTAVRAPEECTLASSASAATKDSWCSGCGGEVLAEGAVSVLEAPAAS